MVKKEYSYTSTYPVSRTACTEPQCLYDDALYITLYNMGLYDAGTETFNFYLFHRTPRYKKKKKYGQDRNIRWNLGTCNRNVLPFNHIL